MAEEVVLQELLSLVQVASSGQPQRLWAIQQMFLFLGRSNLRCEGGVSCVINTQRQTVVVPSWRVNWWWLISVKSQALSVAMFRGDW